MSNPSIELNIIQLVFQVLLGSTIIYVVFRIIISGIMIANAKDDTDKRKEGFQSILSALLGFIIMLSSSGIIIFVREFFVDYNLTIEATNFLTTITSILIFMSTSALLFLFLYRKRKKRYDERIDQVQKENEEIFENIRRNIKNILE